MSCSTSLYFQLIRTTFWTRFDTQKRIDEIEEFNRNKSFISESTVSHSDQILINSGGKTKSSIRQFATWFCGIENSTKETPDFDNNIASIEQSSKSKILLTISLAIVCLISIIIFIVFSIPNWWTWFN